MQHNHLDSQRRDPGVCDACDALWAAQKERLAATKPAIALVKQQEAMGARQTVRNGASGSPARWCMILADFDHVTHNCARGEGHTNHHWCILCPEPHEWTGKR